MMSELKLFTDASVNPKLKIGYGACLLISQTDLLLDNIKSADNLKSLVKIKKFENTSSTKLELQTLLWGLSTIEPTHHKVTIYTDSQNIIGLPARRKGLENNDYHTRNNKLIKNSELYQLFYKVLEQMNCHFIKVKGHKVSSQKTKSDQFFTLVDRASRNALRKSL